MVTQTAVIYFLSAWMKFLMEGTECFGMGC